MTISAEGGRVLGCLVEKQLTTPQQYPLTLNALSSACNQSTNRHPVMVLEDLAVERALDELKALGLVRFVLPSHGRSVTRYRHVFDETYGLDVLRVALLAVLLLRGPQTVGELRARTERMAEFDSVDAVHHELTALADQPEPLVQLLPRRPGQKEDRWQQLLAAEAGAPDRSAETDSRIVGEPETATHASFVRNLEEHGSISGRLDEAESRTDLEQKVELFAARLTELGDEVSVLRRSVVRLRRSLGDDDPDLD